MDQEQLYNRVKIMIESSTKKQMIISTVKMADIWGVSKEEVENGLQQLVQAGKLTKTKLPTPPHHDVYTLKGNSQSA